VHIYESYCEKKISGTFFMWTRCRIVLSHDRNNSVSYNYGRDKVNR